MTKTIVPKGGDQPRPIGKWGSRAEAARALGVTRQELKWIFGVGNKPPKAAKLSSKKGA